MSLYRPQFFQEFVPPLSKIENYFFRFIAYGMAKRVNTLPTIPIIILPLIHIPENPLNISFESLQ